VDLVGGDLRRRWSYRNEEMARSHRCFFGPDRSYHEARRRFVYKLGAISQNTRPAAPATSVGHLEKRAA
jgi:hypothetical protein